MGGGRLGTWMDRRLVMRPGMRVVDQALSGDPACMALAGLRCLD